MARMISGRFSLVRIGFIALAIVDSTLPVSIGLSPVGAVEKLLRI
jgi:hypothetical protein